MSYARLQDHSTTPERTASAARALHLRRQLAQAVEHGAALLAALGLPQPVAGGSPNLGSLPFDPEAAGDALDLAIAALDDLDGDADLEPEPGYDEPEGDDERCASEHDGREPDEDDGDLTAPERHGGGFVRCGPDDAEDDGAAEEDERFVPGWAFTSAGWEVCHG